MIGNYKQWIQENDKKLFTLNEERLNGVQQWFVWGWG